METFVNYSAIHLPPIVLILPMRNGNIAFFLLLFLLLILCSYPTYEEWKQFKFVVYQKQQIPGSYPTYEEWKLLLGNMFIPN